MDAAVKVHILTCTEQGGESPFKFPKIKRRILRGNQAPLSRLSCVDDIKAEKFV